MLLNKQNLQIANLASTEESRYILTAIHVSSKWTATTNGHYLVTVTLPQAKDESFPVIEGFEPTNGTTEPFLLHRNDALAIAKGIPSKTTIPILHHASVGRANDRIQVATTDLASPKVTTIAKVEGMFPNIDAVIPDSAKTKLTIGFSADYLMKLAKSAIDTCGKQTVIKLELRDEHSAAKMSATNSNTEQEWLAVLMPHRLK